MLQVLGKAVLNVQVYCFVTSWFVPLKFPRSSHLRVFKSGAIRFSPVTSCDVSRKQKCQ